MGLGMYAYKIRRLSDDEVSKISGKKKEEVDDAYDYSTILCMDIRDEEKDMICDLAPYLRRVPLVAKLNDFSKLKKEKGIPEDAYIVGEGYSESKIEYTFKHGDDRFEVSFSWEEFESKYVFEKQEDFYVYGSDDVAYWRKEYDTRDAIHEACGKPIENCGYYLCNDEMLDVMVKSGALSPADLPCGDDEAIFYHEWYQWRKMENKEGDRNVRGLFGREKRPD